ncbi:AAA domain-containing protein [Acidovorax sp. 56]|uniref:AAA family ATPase n=1 Tax=Acidovorax sp. 56 TaxID=2035205 RepID=UPI000C51B362|nr:AAA family ATPase [Acidovorax sp. 56]PIF27870.1 AAA domain-containing protein [Acidovorax sp. 56]
MKKLTVNLQNCYGIQFLEHTFIFDKYPRETNSYAVYAPNGLMKTSFSKTFQDISAGNTPKEERYNRPSTCKVEINGVAVHKELIFSLKSEIDIREESQSITDILVNPENKSEYDKILIELDAAKEKLKTSLQRISKVKKKDVEEFILRDWNQDDFPTCISSILKTPSTEELKSFEYGAIFDPKAIEVFNSPEFIAKAKEFNERYQELFNQAGTIYTKNIFNPSKAETVLDTLDRQGFFGGGHLIQLRGELAPIGKEALETKLKAIHSRIDEDEALKKLRVNLSKNAQTQALIQLIENLSAVEVDFLLENIKPANQSKFRQALWHYYLQNNIDGAAYIECHTKSKGELQRIEALAASAVPQWTQAVGLFNDRFLDMPFTLSVPNQVQAALGKESAKLRFTFKDGPDKVEWSRQEVKTLSQGERRALYLLNFIFEVEARKLRQQETIFIIDDIADSFDYKNKHAIIQYLYDVGKVPYFRQIILTHNFDFFRALSDSFVHRDRCLMTNRGPTGIILTKADGVSNYFIGMWKNNVAKDDAVLCATIPFTRNLIEYTKGAADDDYLDLTCLLHWKERTSTITVGKYFEIYNKLFGTEHDTSSAVIMTDLIFAKAEIICQKLSHDGLNLADKVILSIAIRLQSEVFMIKALRIIKSDENYWCTVNNQFGELIKELTELKPTSSALQVLGKVSITVSSNIHLNSFMYEPILDLSIDHLIRLYKEIKNLA